MADGGLRRLHRSRVGQRVLYRKHRLPVLALADLLAPGLMIGLAFGRIGCLMNGCCWGGECDQSSLGITFPQGSPRMSINSIAGRWWACVCKRNPPAATWSFVR